MFCNTGTIWTGTYRMWFFNIVLILRKLCCAQCRYSLTLAHARGTWTEVRPSSWCPRWGRRSRRRPPPGSRPLRAASCWSRCRRPPPRRNPRGIASSLLAVHKTRTFCVQPKEGIRVVDPDPGEQKLPTKIEKKENFHVLKCWMFSFEDWRLLL